jgi:hypothetical protein
MIINRADGAILKTGRGPRGKSFRQTVHDAAIAAISPSVASDATTGSLFLADPPGWFGLPASVIVAHLICSSELLIWVAHLDHSF